MTILICLFKESLESGTALPKTQTEINKLFIAITISRYLRKEKNVFLNGHHLECLPPSYKQQLHILAKLAYVFLDKDKLVFNDGDIATDCPKYMGKFDTLGLLKAVEFRSFREGSSHISYNYLHFSIQEFLAAYYIATSSTKKQIKLLKDKFWDSRYLNTGIMYAGLTAGNSFALKHFLSGRKSVFASKVFGATTIAPETLNNKVNCLHLFQCFLEASDEELVQLVRKFLSDNSVDLGGHALLLKDLYTFCFFLKRSATKQWNAVNLARCYIGDRGLREFFRIFTGFNETKVTIKFMNLSFNHLTSTVIDEIIDICYCFKSERVVLSNNAIDFQVFDDTLFLKYFIANKTIRMHVEKVSNYKSSFYFIHAKFDRKEDLKLLCTTNGDCSLYFWNAGFKLSDFPVLISSIFANFSLVSLYEADLQDHDAVEISSGLKHLISKGTLTNVEYVVQSRTKLFAYKSNFERVSQACENFLMIQYNNATNNGNWISIELSNCEIGDENFKTLMSRTIEQEGKILQIEALNISACSLTTSSINKILMILEVCLIRHLTLINNKINSKEVCSAILAKIFTERKVLNLKYKIPLIILNNLDDSVTAKGSSFFVSNLFSINCEIDATWFNLINLTDDNTMHNVFLSNNNFADEKVIDEILQLCRNPLVTINIFQFNMQENFIKKWEVGLTEKNINRHTFVLTSSTDLIACRATECQISEAMRKIVPTINTVQLKECDIPLLDLGDVLSKASPNIWKDIDLSGSNIKDEGLEVFQECLSSKKKDLYIRKLNISFNSLTSEFVFTIVKCLHYCCIEKLIISPISIKNSHFNKMICECYDIKREFLNFKLNTPLVIHSIISDDEVSSKFNYIAIYVSQGACTIGNNLHLFTNNENLLCDIFIVGNETCYEVFSIKVSQTRLKLTAFRSSIINVAIMEVMSIILKKITSIDMSDSNIQYDDCELLFTLLFNKTDPPAHIREFNFSNNPLKISFVSTIDKIMNCCTVEKLTISNENLYNEIKDIMISHYFAQKLIPNFSAQIPLAIVNNANGSIITQHTTQNLKVFATIYLNNCKISSNTNELLFNHLDQSNHCFNEIVCSNCIKSNDLKNIISFIHNHPFRTISIFENDLDESKSQIIGQIPYHRTRLKLLLVSRTQIFAYKAKNSHIMEVLKVCNPINMFAVQLVDCEICENGIYDIGRHLSENFKALKKLFICQCGINDDNCELLFKSLFFNTSLLTYIKILDISNNQIRNGVLCFKEVVKALQYCVIEQLFISNNFILNDSVIEGVLVEYQSGKKLCNFLYGIPLLVVNNMQGLKKSLICSVFFKCDEIKESDLSNMIIQFKKDEISEWKICLVNMNITANNILNICRVLPNNTRLVVYQTNITNETMIDIVPILNKCQIKDFKIVAVSSQKLFTNTQYDYLISTILRNNVSVNCLQIAKHQIQVSQYKGTFLSCFSRKWNTIDLTGCKIGDEGCKELCKWWSSYKAEHYLDVLNLTSNGLTVSSIGSIISLLHFGVIKKLIVSNNTWTGFDVTRQILADCREILNFKHNVSLNIVGTILGTHDPLFKTFSSVNEDQQCTLNMCNVYTTSLATIYKEFDSLFYSSMQIFNVYVTNKCLDKLENILSILYKNLTIKLGVIHDSFVSNDQAVRVLTNLNRLKFPVDDNYLEHVDISPCIIGANLCRTMFLSFFGCERLRSISELNLSGNLLTESCIHHILNSLQYCRFKEITVSSSNDAFHKLNDGVLLCCRTKSLNFIDGIPLTITNIYTSVHSKKTAVCRSNVSYIYLINSNISNQGNQITHKSNLNRLIVIDSFCKSNFYDIQMLLNNHFNYISIFENSIVDQRIMVLLKKLSASKPDIEYMIFNEDELIAYGVHQCKLLPVLKKCKSIQTLEMINCTYINLHALEIVSDQCKRLYHLKISFSEINSITFQKVSRVLFSSTSALNFLKEFDISYNTLESSMIMECLCNCVIQTLIISQNGIQGFGDYILTAYYYGGMNIQNFILNIPLVVINNYIEQENLFALVFFKNFDLSNTYNFIENMKLHNTANRKFFLLNSYIVLNDLLKCEHLSFQYLAHNYTSVFVLENNLSEEAAVTLSKYLTKLQRTIKLEYLINSATKMFTDTSNKQLLTAAINGNRSIMHLNVSYNNFETGQLFAAFSVVSRVWHTIDLSGCKMGDKNIENLSKQDSIITGAVNIHVLNLSNNSLTPSSIHYIFKIFQYCVIKKLIILDNFIPDESFTKLLHNHHQTFKSIANFKHKLPLVINRSAVNYTTNTYTVYFMNFESNKSVLLSCLLDKKGQAYEFVILNEKKVLSSVLKILLKNSTLKFIIDAVCESAECIPLITWCLQKFYCIKVHNKVMSLNMFDISANEAGTEVLSTLFSFLGTIKLVKILKLSCKNLDIDYLITKYLRYCTIEKLVIYSSFKQDEMFANVILNQFYTGKQLLNLNLSIPFVFMNYVRSNNLWYTYASIIIKDDVHNGFLCKIIETVSMNSKTSALTLYILNKNKITNELKNVLSTVLKYNLCHSNTKAVICLIDLEEDAAQSLIKRCKEHSILQISYVFTTKSKLFAKISKAQLIKSILQSKEAADSHTDVWNTINLSGSNIGDAGLKALYRCFSKFGYINVLNLSCNKLTSTSVAMLVDLLTHCVVHKLIMTQNMTIDFTKKLHSHYHLHKNICNFNHKIPLVVNKGTVLEFFGDNIVNVYCVYLIKHSLTEQVMELSKLNYNGDFYEFFLVDDKNSEIINIASFVSDGKVIKITALNEGVENEMLVDIIFSCFFQPTFYYKFLSSVQLIDPLSSENINEHNKLFNTIFYGRLRLQALINSLKFTSSDYNVIMSYCDIHFNIQHKIVERIVIKCNTSQDKNIDDLIQTECHKGNDLLAFISQVPLVVLKNLTVVSSKSIQKCAAIFFRSGISICGCIRSLLKDLSDHNISKYTLYLLNCNIMQCDLDDALTLINHSNVNEIVMCNVNLKDDEINRVIKIINDKRIMKCIMFILVSKSMLITNVKMRSDFISILVQNNPSINYLKMTNYVLKNLVLNSRRWNTIDLSGCNIGDKGCEVLCEQIFSEKKEIYINELNLTNNALTSSCITTLVKLLRYCVINKLIFSYRSASTMTSTLKEEIIFTDKKLGNFIHKIPLIINETYYSSNTEQTVAESFKSPSGELSYCSHISKFITDYDCVYTSGIIVKQEAKKVSILFQKTKCPNLRCEAITENKALENDVIIEFIRILKRCTDSHIKALCFTACTNTAEMVNQFLLTLRTNKKHIPWNAVELHITLQQFSESYINVTKTIHDKGTVVITCDDFEHALNIKRLSKLKLLNCYIGIKIVAMKITNHPKSTSTVNSWDIFLKECLQKYNLSESFCKMLCIKYPMCKMFASNCLNLKTLNTVISILKTDLFVTITLFEVGVSNALAAQFLHRLKTVKERIQYVVCSSTMLFAFNVEQDLLLKALQTTGDNLVTIELLQCVLFKGNQSTLGPLLHKKLIYCDNLSINHCELTDKLNRLFWESLLSATTIPICIKKLDISHNQVTSHSANCIINALNHYIIKTLILCDNEIHIRAVTDSIVSKYYKGNKIINLNLGIPLVIINTIAQQAFSTALLGNCIIDDQISFLRSTIIEYHITNCSIYCFQGLIFLDTNTIFQSLKMYYNISLDIYIIDPSLKDTTVLKVCKKLGEHYICPTEHRLCVDNINSDTLFSGIFNGIHTISYNSKLEYLNLSDCNLTEQKLLALLNSLHNITTLQHLDLSSIKITTQVAETMAIILCNNHQSINHLNMTKCELSMSAVKIVANALRKTSSLKFLDLSYNTINDKSSTEVASIISNNISMEYLNLNSCNLQENGIVKIFDALSKIKTLLSLDLGNNAISNVSAAKLRDFIDTNSALSKLHLSNCFGPNISLKALNSLTVNRKGILTYLNISFNRISSSTKILASIICYSKLEHLDLGHCYLKSPQLLEILNEFVTMNITLKHFSIETNIVTESVAQKLALIFSKSTRLQHLNMSSCSLSEFHIGKYVTINNFSALQHLNISKNYLKSFYVAKNIKSLLHGAKHTLKYLNISDCNFEDVAIQTIADSLTYLTFLYHLDISKIKITRQAAERLATSLKNFCLLEHLNVSNCFSGEEIFTLFYAFKTQKSLKHLNISLNPINNKVAICLADAIKGNIKLEHLNLAQCGMSETGLLAILKAVGSFGTLRHLDIASNIVTEKVARELTNLGACNRNFNYLNLANTEIKSAQLFSPLFQVKLNFHCLDLNGNTIDYNDSVAIANVVAKCSAIKHLSFSWTVLSALNVHVIMVALINTTSLQHLNLESCVISNETSKILATIVANCTRLSYLNLSKTKLQQEGLIMIAKSLTQSYSIQSLILESICISNEAAKEISFAIQHFLPLVHLSLFECKVKENGMLNIASALRSISTLQHLDLSCTIISDKAATSIASALLKNPRLKHLDFSDCEFENDGECTIRRILSSLTILNYCNF